MSLLSILSHDFVLRLIFTAIQTLAVSTAGVFFLRFGRRHGVYVPRLLMFLLVSSILGFIGSRLLSLTLGRNSFEYFFSPNAGLSSSGGIALAIAGIPYLLDGLDSMTEGHLLDGAMFSFLLGFSIARVGCLVTGDGDYGTPTSLPWGITYPHGLVPTSVPVHPTPLYEIIGYTLLFVFLWRNRRVWEPGTSFRYGLIIASAMRFLIEFTRSWHSVLFFSIAQWGCLLFIGLGVALTLEHHAKTLPAINIS